MDTTLRRRFTESGHDLEDLHRPAAPQNDEGNSQDSIQNKDEVSDSAEEEKDDVKPLEPGAATRKM